MQENEKTYERDIYMEERNEELETSADTEVKEETEIQTSENSENASADSEPKKQERPAANFGLLLLAGVYLLYTGYKLCANVLKGEEGASWGFFIAGAAFLIIGAGMLLWQQRLRNREAMPKRLQRRKRKGNIRLSRFRSLRE